MRSPLRENSGAAAAAQAPWPQVVGRKKRKKAPSRSWDTASEQENVVAKPPKYGKKLSARKGSVQSFGLRKP
jgi:hypothetical protein